MNALVKKLLGQVKPRHLAAMRSETEAEIRGLQDKMIELQSHVDLIDDEMLSRKAEAEAVPSEEEAAEEKEEAPSSTAPRSPRAGFQPLFKDAVVPVDKPWGWKA